jgi:guanine nucleotide-binding protein subunit alpha
MSFKNSTVVTNAGAGESGKSTLVKQMKIIHSDGFTIEELRSFRPTVMDNLLSSMKYVLTGMGLLRINLQSAKNKVCKVSSTYTFHKYASFSVYKHVL